MEHCFTHDALHPMPTRPPYPVLDSPKDLFSGTRSVCGTGLAHELLAHAAVGTPHWLMRSTASCGSYRSNGVPTAQSTRCRRTHLFLYRRGDGHHQTPYSEDGRYHPHFKIFRSDTRLNGLNFGYSVKRHKFGYSVKRLKYVQIMMSKWNGYR